MFSVLWLFLICLPSALEEANDLRRNNPFSPFFFLITLQSADDGRLAARQTHATLRTMRVFGAWGRKLVPCHGPSPVHSPSGTWIGCVVLEPPPWGQHCVPMTYIHTSTRHVAVLWLTTIWAEGMLGEGNTCSSNQGAAVSCTEPKPLQLPKGLFDGKML